MTSPHSPYPQYFLSGFRRFTKTTFVRSGGDCSPPVPLVAPPLVLLAVKMVADVTETRNVIPSLEFKV